MKYLKIFIGIFKARWLLWQCENEAVNRYGFNGKRVFINTVKFNCVSTPIEFFFGLYVVSRGGSVFQVIDDGFLEHHDLFQYCQGKRELNPSKLKIYKCMISIYALVINRIFTRYKVLTIGALLRDNNEASDRPREYQNLVDLWANSSTERFYQSDLSNVLLVEDYQRRSRKNCWVGIAIAKAMLDDYECDSLISSHGIYSLWAPAYNLFKDRGDTRVLLYGTNTYKEGELTFSSLVLQCQSQSDEYKDYMRSSPSNLEIAEEFMRSRLSHSSKDTQVYYAGRSGTIELNKSYFNILVCPNVVWDGNVPDRDALFDGLIDWVNWYQNLIFSSENVHVYIRFHPAESTWYPNALSLYDVLERKGLLLQHERITYLKSDEKLDLYSFLNEFDLIGVYDGILALEAAYVGVPVFIGALGRFSGFQLSDTFNSKEQMLKEIQKASKGAVLNPGCIETAIKCCAFYIDYSSVRLSIVDNVGVDYGANVMRLSKQDLLENEKLNFWMSLLIK
ncbi:MAG: hypothetical protein HWE20_09655 [Gammaproteobacteria bacterium]|nr:hypothetical protein [Gammaproteobacteria bacterium]